MGKMGKLAADWLEPQENTEWQPEPAVYNPDQLGLEGVPPPSSIPPEIEPYYRRIEETMANDPSPRGAHVYYAAFPEGNDGAEDAKTAAYHRWHAMNRPQQQRLAWWDNYPRKLRELGIDLSEDPEMARKISDKHSQLANPHQAGQWLDPQEENQPEPQPHEQWVDGASLLLDQIAEGMPYRFKDADGIQAAEINGEYMGPQLAQTFAGSEGTVVSVGADSDDPHFDGKPDSDLQGWGRYVFIARLGMCYFLTSDQVRNPDQLTLEAKTSIHTAEQDYYYHAAPTTQRQRIMQHGLQPAKPGRPESTSSNPEWRLQPEGVYVMNQPGGWGHGPGIDYWRIPKSDVEVAYEDPRVANGYFIPHPIANPQLHAPDEAQWKRHDQEWMRQTPPIQERKQLGIGLPDRVIGSSNAYSGPEGIAYQIAANPADREGFTVEAWDNGQRIGTLGFYSDGQVSGVRVDPNYQRQGIATQMWNMAYEHNPNIHHQPEEALTEMGYPWAETTKGTQQHLFRPAGPYYEDGDVPVTDEYKQWKLEHDRNFRPEWMRPYPRPVTYPNQLTLEGKTSSSLDTENPETIAHLPHLSRIHTATPSNAQIEYDQGKPYVDWNGKLVTDPWLTQEYFNIFAILSEYPYSTIGNIAYYIDGQSVYVGSIWVDPAYRKTDVAMLLYQALKQQTNGLPIETHLQEKRLQPVIDRHNTNLPMQYTGGVSTNPRGDTFLTYANGIHGTPTIPTEANTVRLENVLWDKDTMAGLPFNTTGKESGENDWSPIQDKAGVPEKMRTLHMGAIEWYITIPFVISGDPQEPNIDMASHSGMEHWEIAGGNLTGSENAGTFNVMSEDGQVFYAVNYDDAWNPVRDFVESEVAREGLWIAKNEGYDVDNAQPWNRRHAKAGNPYLSRVGSGTGARTAASLNEWQAAGFYEGLQVRPIPLFDGVTPGVPCTIIGFINPEGIQTSCRVRYVNGREEQFAETTSLIPVQAALTQAPQGQWLESEPEDWQQPTEIHPDQMTFEARIHKTGTYASQAEWAARGIVPGATAILDLSWMRIPFDPVEVHIDNVDEHESRSGAVVTFSGYRGRDRVMHIESLTPVQAAGPPSTGQWLESEPPDWQPPVQVHPEQMSFESSGQWLPNDEDEPEPISAEQLLSFEEAKNQPDANSRPIKQGDWVYHTRYGPGVIGQIGPLVEPGYRYDNVFMAPVNHPVNTRIPWFDSYRNEYREQGNVPFGMVRNDWVPAHGLGRGYNPDQMSFEAAGQWLDPGEQQEQSSPLPAVSYTDISQLPVGTRVRLYEYGDHRKPAPVPIFGTVTESNSTTSPYVRVVFEPFQTDDHHFNVLNTNPMEPGNLIRPDELMPAEGVAPNPDQMRFETKVSDWQEEKHPRDEKGRFTFKHDVHKLPVFDKHGKHLHTIERCPHCGVLFGRPPDWKGVLECPTCGKDVDSKMWDHFERQFESKTAARPAPNDPAEMLATSMGWTFDRRNAEGHRYYTWTAPDGTAHVAQCGSGEHADDWSGKEDARRLRGRIRQCMAGACMHVKVPEQAQVIAEPGAPAFQVGQEVTWNGQVWWIMELAGEYTAIYNAQGAEDVVPTSELQLINAKTAADWLQPLEQEPEVDQSQFGWVNPKSYKELRIGEKFRPDPAQWGSIGGIEGTIINVSPGTECLIGVLTDANAPEWAREENYYLPNETQVWREGGNSINPDQLALET